MRRRPTRPGACPGILCPGEARHGCAERLGVDRRVAIKQVFHLLEQLGEFARIDQTIDDHRLYVAQVLSMTALELRQRLGIEVEMVKVDRAFPGDERTARLPAGQRWNENV